MAATFKVTALNIQRGPPMRVFAEVSLSDAEFAGQTTVEITDATTLANIQGSGVLARVVTEVNTKLPGRNAT